MYKNFKAILREVISVICDIYYYEIPHYTEMMAQRGAPINVHLYHIRQTADVHQELSTRLFSRLFWLVRACLLFDQSFPSFFFFFLKILSLKILCSPITSDQELQPLTIERECPEVNKVGQTTELVPVPLCCCFTLNPPCHHYGVF